jgi:hypothetical protein
MNVFSLLSVTPEQVIVGVNADTPLTVAQHPYINAQMAYITLTRGSKHILTVINKDGSTPCSFWWGVGGYTVIGEELKRLKLELIKFIQLECHVILEWDDGPLDNATFFYNNNLKRWQLTLCGNRMHTIIRAHVWAELNITSADEMKIFCQDFVSVKDWAIKTAETGITVWEAIDPTLAPNPLVPKI